MDEVETTGLPVHMIVFPLRPSLLQFVTPEILSSRSRVAPGEMVVVEAVVFVYRHPVTVAVALADLFMQRLGELEQLGRSGDIEVPGAAHGDSLQALVAHDHADAPGRTGVGVVDRSH